MVRHGTIRSEFLMMLLGVAGAGVCQLMAPRITPPGNVWGIADTGTLLLLALAATWAGWLGLGASAGILGAVAGLFFDVWLPDSRDLLSIAQGTERVDFFIVRYFLFSAATGAGVAIIAVTARRVRRVRDKRSGIASPICRNCGYNLRGLPEPRCPECGERF